MHAYKQTHTEEVEHAGWVVRVQQRWGGPRMHSKARFRGCSRWLFLPEAESTDHRCMLDQWPLINIVGCVWQLPAAHWGAWRAELVVLITLALWTLPVPPWRQRWPQPFEPTCWPWRLWRTPAGPSRSWRRWCGTARGSETWLNRTRGLNRTERDVAFKEVRWIRLGFTFLNMMRDRTAKEVKRAATRIIRMPTGTLLFRPVRAEIQPLRWKKRTITVHLHLLVKDVKVLM